MHAREYAYIGDAVWELFVRQIVIKQSAKPRAYHEITTSKVNAKFQHAMLDVILQSLSPEELDIVRRARNLPIPVARKSIQYDYRQATAFEAIIGFWFINNPDRLETCKEMLQKYI